MPEALEQVPGNEPQNLQVPRISVTSWPSTQNLSEKPPFVPAPAALPTRWPTKEDIVSQINGNFGFWQLRTILLVFLCKIPSAWFMACVIYTAPSPQKGEYYCKPTFLANISSSLEINHSDWVRQQHTIIDARQTDRQFVVDACNVYEKKLERHFAERLNYSNPFEQPNDNIVQVIPCNTFEHNTEYQSLVTQFDLVCSRQLLVSVSQCFHAVGNVFGGLIAYHV